LVAEAINGQRLSVGSPYFDRMTMPIAVALLFLMAVAPVLPWRKASGELLRHRIQWPAWIGVLTLVICVASGVRGLNPLLAFGLGAFAAASAGRQLVLATRRQGIRGLLGRANGGMIVHIGVVVVAVAFAASHSFAHRAEVTLKAGESYHVGGHTVTYLGVATVQHDNRQSTEASVRVDGGKVYRPAISQFVGGGQAIGTPSVRSTARDDVYLTLVGAPQHPGDPAVLGVLVAPLIYWLWVGGGIIAFGTLLAAWPGRRRRPTEPVSSPVAGDRRGRGGRAAGDGSGGRGGRDPAPLPVGAGVERVVGGFSLRSFWRGTRP
jgi:cytochrome c-type biogenesis protein CcmF